MGRRGFALDGPHPRYGERPREIEEYTFVTGRLQLPLYSEDLVHRHHVDEHPLCADLAVKACRPTLLAGKTKRGNPWGWRCRIWTKKRAPKNVVEIPHLVKEPFV